MVGQKYYSTCTFACICAVVQWCGWCSGAQGVAPGLPIGDRVTTLEILVLRSEVLPPPMDGCFRGAENGHFPHFQLQLGTPTPQW